MGFDIAAPTGLEYSLARLFYNHVAATQLGFVPKRILQTWSCCAAWFHKC